ncbi:Concanavalin A-like lectin family protein [Dorcoceras hygrometricum]|uniref:Concanavalin A-like lectin family protein n=1 Tax=Dorcoceras hygrometricum TaxID=472368 RepID=A0A2Z7AWL7_9LAMI|nr:Concanavalin A-like lectin family protein [Dorcoceras hygrometricum]
MSKYDHPSTFTRHSIHPIPFLITFLAIYEAPHFALSVTHKPQFGSDLVLIGDAKFANDSSFVQLTDPRISSASSGFLFRRRPIKLFSSYSKSRKPVSFSTEFSFSISPQNGDGIAFLLVPRSMLSRFSKGGFGVLKESRFLGVEFDTSVDENVGDVNANHVGVDVGSLDSVKTSNVSSVDLVLNSGMQLHSWVDYDSSSKRIEVRLDKSGGARPYDPLLVYGIDLGEMWRNEEVFVGLSSSSGKTMQTSCVYSWKFRTRSVPSWLHSQPLDPRVISQEQEEKRLAQKKRICALGFLSGLVFIVGCGALLALIILFLWAMFENSLETILTIPAKSPVHSGDFRYQKINVVVEDNLSEANN